MKKIIAIIRNPKEAKNFIRFCGDMSVELKTDVDLYYFHAPQVYPMSSEGLTGASAQYLYGNEQHLEEDIKDVMNNRIAAVKEEMDKNVTFRFFYQDGTFEMYQTEIVEDEESTIIAVEGRKEDQFATSSSSNMDILSHAKCPVLVVPEFAKYAPFRKIVYATDYNVADVITLSRIIELTKAFNPHLIALHITDNDDFQEKIKGAGFLDLVKEKTAYEKIEFKSVKKTTRGTARTIHDFAGQISSDLIVLLKENKSFLESVFKSSVSEKLSQDTMVPALIYHEK